MTYKKLKSLSNFVALGLAIITVSDATAGEKKPSLLTRMRNNASSASKTVGKGLKATHEKASKFSLTGTLDKIKQLNQTVNETAKAASTIGELTALVVSLVDEKAGQTLESQVTKPLNDAAQKITAKTERIEKATDLVSHTASIIKDDLADERADLEDQLAALDKTAAEVEKIIQKADSIQDKAAATSNSIKTIQTDINKDRMLDNVSAVAELEKNAAELDSEVRRSKKAAKDLEDEANRTLLQELPFTHMGDTGK